MTNAGDYETADPEAMRQMREAQSSDEWKIDPFYIVGFIAICVLGKIHLSPSGSPNIFLDYKWVWTMVLAVTIIGWLTSRTLKIQDKLSASSIRNWFLITTLSVGFVNLMVLLLVGFANFDQGSFWGFRFGIQIFSQGNSVQLAGMPMNSVLVLGLLISNILCYTTLIYGINRAKDRQVNRDQMRDQARQMGIRLNHERALAKQETLQQRFDSLSRDLSHENPMTRLYAAVGLAEIAQTVSPVALVESDFTEAQSPKNVTFYPWYLAVKKLFSAALIHEKDDAVRSQIDTESTRIVAFDIS